MVGAVFVAAGLQAVKFAGLNKVLIALVVSPLMGFVIGFLITHLIYFLVRGATPRVTVLSIASMIVSSLAIFILPILGSSVDRSSLNTGFLLLAMLTLMLGTLSVVMKRRLVNA
jgi:hypothetical protein